MPTMNLPPSTVEQYTYGDLDLLLTWIPCQGHPLADVCALGRVCVVAGHSPKLSQRLFSRNKLPRGSSHNPQFVFTYDTSYTEYSNT